MATSMILSSLLPCKPAFAAVDAGESFVYNGHTYAFLDAESYGLESYREVAAFCRHIGGHLAVINDEEENQALFEALKENYDKTAFFGYSDTENEGYWLWTDDKSTYENWTRHGDVVQPDNGITWGGDEDCAEFNYERGKEEIANDGTWNDAPFMANTSVFICEWEQEVNPDTLAKEPKKAKAYEGYIDVLNQNRSNITKWEAKWEEYNRYWRSEEGNDDPEFYLDSRQIAFRDLNGDGIEELMFTGRTDETGLEGAEEYIKDLYIFTLENGSPVKIFQTRIYAEAGGGWRYLLAETKDHQLAVVISTVDEFEDCAMDIYRLSGKSLQKTEHHSVYMDEYAEEGWPRYTVERDGKSEEVSKDLLENEVRQFTGKLELPLIKSGCGSCFEVYDIGWQQECCSMNCTEALGYLEAITR